MKSKVLMTKSLNPESLIQIYQALGKELTGKIAVKIHSGEAGNQNYLHPEYFKPMIDYVKGTVVENNTAYPGERNSTEKHQKLMKDHEWTKYFQVDIMDSEGNDLALPIPNGKVLKTDYVGGHIANYDSMLVLSHFKGHPMGGFGGALKQLAIGCASSEGKAWIHSAGRTKDQVKVWEDLPEQDLFLESMADAASAVYGLFKDKIVFISVMRNMSVDCDCVSHAEDPCLKDIGILASLDPIAIDQACIDLVLATDDPGKAHFMERVNSRNGLHTIESAAKLGFGTREYELVKLDDL